MNPAEKTVLVVDDDPAIRESLEELLRFQGYRVLSAADGVEGLGVVRGQRPDLIVLDVAMPRLDGFRMATLIKSDPALRQIPIILYSGRLEESFAVLAYETKAEYFLPKAGNLRSILEAISQLMERTPGETGAQ
jgi:two-component system response regulator MprA